MGVQVNFSFGNFRLLLRTPEGHCAGGGSDEGQLTEAVVKDCRASSSAAASSTMPSSSSSIFVPAWGRQNILASHREARQLGVGLPFAAREGHKS